MSAESESSPEHRLSLSEKLARRRERHIQRSMAYRVLFVIAAFAILIGGIALVPLPGPGWAIVFIGLGMLALVLSEDLRKRALDLLFGAEEEFEYSSTTTPSPAPETAAA